MLKAKLQRSWAKIMPEGKKLVKKDYPGFTGNRFLNVIVMEGFNMLDAGIASAEDIERSGYIVNIEAIPCYETEEMSVGQLP